MSSRVSIPQHQRPGQQRGLILITSLIMVVMLTLVVVTALSVSLASRSVAKNIDGSLAAKASAQMAIETIINDPGFVDNPAAVSNAPIQIDANGDGTTDYSVALQASCVAQRKVPQSEIDSNNENEYMCNGGGDFKNSGFAVTSGTVLSGLSDCTDTRWNISATSTRSSYGDRATVNQGVSVRVPNAKAVSYCG